MFHRHRPLRLIPDIGLLTLVAAGALACTRTGAVVTAVPAPTPLPSMAVEPTQPTGDIAPVSISHPSAGAKAAFHKCLVGDIGGSGMYAYDLVAGMGQIPSASDLYRYIPLTGREPELKRHDPVWVIQFTGDFPMRGGASPGPAHDEIWIDPACIVMSDTSGFYGVGPTRMDGSSVVTTPEPPRVPPDRKLPPLIP
jgi:hypothetical protein